ncbi:hypothetical protein GV794_16520 [Nocardia cyriacigeorgica]|uniref:Uncharacterized protein n=1 Tax=Nocardia cyriacigeorgica TaxID=135487 RepID=A0A6P1D744_9NOCA|nr:hypothetical protein [Nocardia cyriacigeorgica]NEW39614.1 hypothetical protein [Nocardia cyriacigeorgica]NEW44673.1 hypothetical protein [Nocardia cyriacigeorgica]NEW50104.1 hypothetical protein [Nocardia cyriacigeorgica]NEW57251.1 hypothetical protein [Nocardia cyriacigeorgica]
MNLRSLLHRHPPQSTRAATRLPQLPLIEPEGESTPRVEERLERLLTPTELDLVLHHRV